MKCPEHQRREAMTDAEFWEHVFRRDEESWAEYAWAMDGPDVWAIKCIRCGVLEEVGDPEGPWNDGLCSQCADESLPDLEDDVLTFSRQPSRRHQQGET